MGQTIFPSPHYCTVQGMLEKGVVSPSWKYNPPLATVLKVPEVRLTFCILPYVIKERKDRMTRLLHKSGIQDANMQLTGLAAPRSVCNLSNPSVISSAHEDGFIFVFFHVDRVGLGRKAVNTVTSIRQKDAR
jgi:hypothetical protein